MNDEPDWHALCPEYSLRPQQLDALRRLYTALYVDDNDVAVLEAPTGVGKSIIELAMCRYAQSLGGTSFIVTPQKTLQDQLGKLPGLKVMKGKSSYHCALVPELTAASAPCVGNSGIREEHRECADDVCPYFNALADAKASPVVVHNYASLIAQTHIGNHFQPRDIICLDEGHTAANWIRSYMSIEITKADLATITTLQPPDNIDMFMGWFRMVMSNVDSVPDGVPERVVSLIMRVLSHPSVYGVPDGEKLRTQWTEEFADDPPERRMSFMAWATRELARGEDALVPWATESEPHDTGGTKYTCIPIKVAPMANVLTAMGRKIIIVTATALDPKMLLAELGLKNKPHVFVSLDSAFHPDIRPIVKRYAGSMSYASARDTFPKMCQELYSIVSAHPDEAGIVHTVSHALAYDVAREVKLMVTSPRTVVQMPREGRDGIIEKFMTGGFGPNAILVGPGLMEGIDAKYGAARWQALCKVPWPHRKDPVVSYWLDDPDPAMKRVGDRWYTWKTVQQCVQGIGRVCRADDDFGITYLLDSGFEKILNSNLVPDYIRDAIRKERR